MKSKFYRILVFAIVICSCQNTEKEMSLASTKATSSYAMVIHGGAGTITRANMTAEKEQAYRAVLENVLSTGRKILQEGGTAMDAVVECIKIMENDTLFNAGKGAVFTNDETNELDASIMHGEKLEAGAVGGVTNIKNPILAAKAVLEQSEHVMMVGIGAENFAKKVGLEQVDPSYFHTSRRYNSLLRIKNETKTELDHDDRKHGTVGVVALDMTGNIVAGTSTGGMTNKRFNRIGDSPVIGAGTYANNLTCGVSCTGHGEYFIRYAVAHAVSAAMEFGGLSLQEAGDKIVHEQLVNAGGSGGLVALDKNGNITMPFNTEGMYRGYVNEHEQRVFIYKDETN